MPEEPIRTIDIPAEGTAGAAFMQARREQDRARREEQFQDAAAKALEAKNRRIEKLQARIKELEEDVEQLIEAGQALEGQRNRAVDGLKVYSEALKAACEAAEGDEQLTGSDAKEKGEVLLKEAAERLGVDPFPTR